MSYTHMLMFVSILLTSAASMMRASQDNAQSYQHVVYARQGDGRNNQWLSLYAPLANSGSHAQAPTQQVAFGQPSDDTEFDKNNIVYPVYGMPHHTSQMQEYYQAQLEACGGVLARNDVSYRDMRALMIATAKRIQPISVIAAFLGGWLLARWHYKDVTCKKTKDKKRTSVLKAECSDNCVVLS